MLVNSETEPRISQGFARQTPRPRLSLGLACTRAASRRSARHLL